MAVCSLGWGGVFYAGPNTPRRALANRVCRGSVLLRLEVFLEVALVAYRVVSCSSVPWIPVEVPPRAGAAVGGGEKCSRGSTIFCSSSGVPLGRPAIFAPGVVSAIRGVQSGYILVPGGVVRLLWPSLLL